MRRPTTAAQARAELARRVPRNPGSGEVTIADLTKRQKTKPTRASMRAALQRAVVDCTELPENRLRARHFVGLYAKLHTWAYEVEPAELEDDFFPAVSAASRLLEHEFRNDAPAMAAWLRWVWKREKVAEKRRRTDGGDRGGFRIGWRLQFLKRNLLVDYRIAQQREMGARR